MSFPGLAPPPLARQGLGPFGCVLSDGTCPGTREERRVLCGPYLVVLLCYLTYEPAAPRPSGNCNTVLSPSTLQ